MNEKRRMPTPALAQACELASDHGLEQHGLSNFGQIYWNLPAPALVEEAVFRGEGVITQGGPLAVHTGEHTARAAKDKFIVKEPSSEEDVNWGEYNTPIEQEKFEKLFNRMRSYLQGRDLFVQDCYVGNEPKYRMPIRVITEDAWQNMFAQNMFILPKREAYKSHNPQFTIIAAPGFRADPELDGVRSETAIMLDFSKRLAIVCNSAYGGEIKKTFFTILNYLLPLQGVMSMHCSANVGKDGDVALFFGLSGTGKTSLSADKNRALIGDDEHGWWDGGVFNYEGGCYAKVIRLSAEHEPEIYACTRKFNTILENVVYDTVTRVVDLDDDSLTENTRASYPLTSIDNVVEGRMTKTHPKNVIFLACDASGVLPPISRLSPDQAQYHFISGYTSKVGGTEKGAGTDPKATFSACFGAPFMVLHPFKYADLLSTMMDKHRARCWLVNTGWSGGPFGAGERISIHYTRALLNAALEGKLDNVDYRTDKVFGFEVPMDCPGVPKEILDPANTWSDQDAYWKRYDDLAAKYIENFKKYEDGCSAEVKAAGPKRLLE